MLSFNLLGAMCALSTTSLTYAFSFNVGDTSSVQSTASTLASHLLSFYNPAAAPAGVLPQPYYWWESGGMWNGLLDYWHYTGDGQYLASTTGALTANLGATNDFMGPLTDGNDDQGWWALATMSAAEYGLPNPTGTTWLAVAQTVYGELAGRWDTSVCGGGLRWKIDTARADGGNYKNSISNGLFFQLSARLFRLTGDGQYAAMADTIFSWTQSVGLIDRQTWAVYDGTDDLLQCREVDHTQWSYNVGVFLFGSAVMQAMPNSDAKWAGRTTGLLGATSHFFVNGIMQETQCEPSNTCNVDQLSFKAYLARYMAATAITLPYLAPQITPLLESSAGGAASSCTGDGGVACGTKWTIDAWDGTMGVGQQLSALEVVHGLLGANNAAVKRVKSKMTTRDADGRRVQFSQLHRG